ncbi:MAG: hypothetical protein IJY17_03780 [Alphaproteobacteria bacterium]|nr:hypothetical protein [Alphaproteobacteria bacterium]
MKKYFLMLAAFLAVPSVGFAETVFNDADSFVVAKAVKLGRGTSIYASGTSAISTNQGQNTATVDDGSCTASSECEKGEKCSDKKCVKCADGETCDTCPDNYVGNGKGGCRLQCTKGQANCELCTTGQVYDGTKCRMPCDGVTCPTGTSCRNGTTSACCVPDAKACTVANCGSCNEVSGVCEACASGYLGLMRFETGEIIECTQRLKVCSVGTYDSGDGVCIACTNKAKCSSCSSDTPYWCSASGTCSASSTCGGCSSDSDCTVSSGYACVSGSCTKKCSSSSTPYWCSSQSTCTASALACSNLSLNLAGDCYTPTDAERCNCSNDLLVQQKMVKTLQCAVREELTDCDSYCAMNGGLNNNLR